MVGLARISQMARVLEPGGGVCMRSITPADCTKDAVVRASFHKWCSVREACGGTVDTKNDQSTFLNTSS